MGVPPQIPVTSPTFMLINEYEGRLHLYHLDLYRLVTVADLETIPWRESLFGAGSPSLNGRIAWVGRSRNRWDIRFEFLDDDSRLITLPPGARATSRG